MRKLGKARGYFSRSTWMGVAEGILYFVCIFQPVFPECLVEFMKGRELTKWTVIEGREHFK